MSVRLFVCTLVCLFVCTSVCLLVCTLVSVCLYISVSVCLYSVHWLSVCLYVSVSICLYVSVSVCQCVVCLCNVHWLSVCLYVSVSVCLYVSVSVCQCVCLSVQCTLVVCLQFMSVCLLYQSAMCKACARLFLRLLYVFCICLFVHSHILCAIITPCTLPCDFTLVDSMTSLSTTCTMSSLAQFKFEIPRSRSNIDATTRG